MSNFKIGEVLYYISKDIKVTISVSFNPIKSVGQECETYRIGYFLDGSSVYQSHIVKSYELMYYNEYLCIKRDNLINIIINE